MLFSDHDYLMNSVGAKLGISLFAIFTCTMNIADSNKKTAKPEPVEPGQWVNAYGDILYRYAIARIQSKEVAEDLVQDTFLSALKGMESFRGESSQLTWMISILRRKIIDYYRKKSTKKEVSATQFDLPFHKDGIMEHHWLQERAPKNWHESTDEPLHQDEFQKIMQLCLSMLPDKWKSVFILKVMEEMQSDEVCKEIGCTASNLWVILHRARLQLRECIENKWLS